MSNEELELEVEQAEEQEIEDGEKQTEGDVKEAATQEAEKEARRQGWRPEDEFKGKKSDWVDADTWLRRGREINPILQKHNNELKERLRVADEKIAVLDLTLKEHAKLWKQTQENAYERQIKELKSDRTLARREGEDDVVDEINDAINHLTKQKESIKVPGEEVLTNIKTPVPNPEGARIFEEWAEDNSWYNQDKALTAMADGVFLKLTNADPSLRGTKKVLKLVEDEVKEMAPEKFSNPLRKKGSGVGGSSSSTTGSSSKPIGGKGYKDLPAEAKTAARQFETRGVSREDYAKAYFESNE